MASLHKCWEISCNWDVFWIISAKKNIQKYNFGTYFTFSLLHVHVLNIYEFYLIMFSFGDIQQVCFLEFSKVDDVHHITFVTECETTSSLV